MMSWMLRGWANDRGDTNLDFDPNDGSVDFAEFYDSLSERWNGITIWKIIDVTSRNTKGRYEIFGSAKDDATRRGQASNWNLLKGRAIQGHNSKVINEDADPLKIPIRQYALEQGWTPSFHDLPKLGPVPCMTEVVASMPKLGYHASYWRNFEGVALNGILAGGPTPSGSSGRTFAMMSLTPQWKRDSSHGIRPSAEIKFVIDLQAAALDGCRFFLTRTETLQTPDWISNRSLVYAYDRHRQDIIWFNRVYESVRRRIEDEKQTSMPHIVPSEVVDPIVGQNIHCAMEYYLGEVLPSHTEWLPQVWNMPMPAAVTQTSLDFYNLSVSVPEGHALHQSDNKDFPELGYRMQVKVCPLHGDRKIWQEFTSWRAMHASHFPHSGALSAARTTLMIPGTVGDAPHVQSLTATSRHHWPLIAIDSLLP